MNDKQITDHYAIIPTGQGLNNLKGLAPLAGKVYDVIVRRFLSIFYPPAVYLKFALCIRVKEERFFANFKVLSEEGYLKVAGRKDGAGTSMAAAREGAPGNGSDGRPVGKGNAPGNNGSDGRSAGPQDAMGNGAGGMSAQGGENGGSPGAAGRNAVTNGTSGGNALGNVSAGGKDAPREEGRKDGENEETEIKCDGEFMKLLGMLKKGDKLSVDSYEVKEGETSPPKRYTSGSIILTMENAGQFIEDEELRAQIKGSGIGTSATRAEILKKLVNIEYLALNKKTQTLTPTLMGEMIYDVVESSIKALLDPALTASWEKGLTLVADGNITSKEYMDKLNGFVGRRTEHVKQLRNQRSLYDRFQAAAVNYKSR